MTDEELKKTVRQIIAAWGLDAGAEVAGLTAEEIEHLCMDVAIAVMQSVEADYESGEWREL